MRTLKINETREWYEFLWKNKYRKSYEELLKEYKTKNK